MTKTVTLPIEEYEELVQAQKAADSQLQKANKIIRENSIHVCLEYITYGQYMCDCVTRNIKLNTIISNTENENWKYFIEEIENHYESEIRSLKKQINDKHDLANQYSDDRINLSNKICEYNKKGRWYRFFNKCEVT